ncbi:hypothetical protein MTR67_004817, partial [Solanum verrucosum]
EISFLHSAPANSPEYLFLYRYESGYSAIIVGFGIFLTTTRCQTRPVELKNQTSVIISKMSSGIL